MLLSVSDDPGACYAVLVVHLVLVNHPAPVFSVPSVVAAALFHDFIDGHMLQSSVCCQELAVARLADTGSTGDDDVWLTSGHVWCAGP